MEPIFFSSWHSLGRVLLVGTLAYIGLVLMLRITGKRTLSKLNAFDLVVTVALGSTLATVLLNKRVPLLEGIAAFALLCGLQFSVTWASVRWPWVRGAVASEPTLLLFRGQVLDAPMKRQRITREELQAAARQSSVDSLDTIYAIILETDGTLSVVTSPKSDNGSIAGVPAPD